ncbi:MAG: serine/threonine protein kinase [Phycisphaerales bacterium]|nr:MAG: serine/threonine protein kinase [Phycisphaerales bacterium]
MAFTFKHGDKPLEGYVIQRGVGKGGFGEVYYALSEGGKEVALKYLRDNPQIELRGVSHCMNLKSPHLVTIYDVKQNDEGEYFIIMEYIDGPSLRDLLVAEPSGLGAQKAAFFVSEIAKGLSYLHDRGIIHRDMKPGNIFYEDGYVKIGDYGLSKFISLSRHSGQTASVGTVHYMAPEVGSGNYHRGIDIYALGVMLYEMLLGRVPFEGSSMGEVLMKHLTEQPEVDALPDPFGDVIRRALAKDPNDRYQSINEMAQDIIAADHVRKSIADFKPGSLTTIARQAVETQVMDSPHPSPQGRPFIPPPRPRPHDDNILDAQAFSDRLAQHMERRGQPQYGPPSPAVMPAIGERPTPADMVQSAAPRGSRIGGFVLSAIVAIGLSVGVSLLAGVRNTIPEHTLMIFAFIMAIRIGVGIAERVVSRMAAPASSKWANRLIVLGCSTLPILLVGAIANEQLGRFYDRTNMWMDHNDMWMLALSVWIASGVVDWMKRLRDGLRGQVCFGSAFWAGLFCCIAAAILSEANDSIMIMAAGIGAAASLSLQASALFKRPALAGGAMPPQGPPGALGPEPSKKNDSRNAAIAEAAEALGDLASVPAALAGVASLSQECREPEPSGFYSPARRYAAAPVRRRRSTPARVFWGIVSGLLLFGAAVCGLGTGMIAHGDEEIMGFLIGASCCVVMAIFTLTKTTHYKRLGFWNETARPFLTCAFFSGAAALALVIAFLPMIKDDRFGVAVGLVFCLVFGLFCAFMGGRRQRLVGTTQAGPYERDVAGEPSAPAVSPYARTSALRLRRPIARAFWALVSAALLSGAGINGMAIGLMAQSDEEMMGFIIGAACCGIMAIFTLLKTTRHKRFGFWNETARPLLVCTFLCGLVALALVIGFIDLDDAGLFGVISGMIPCGALALLFLFLGGFRRHGIAEVRPKRSRRWALVPVIAVIALAALAGMTLMARLSRGGFLPPEIPTPVPRFTTSVLLTPFWEKAIPVIGTDDVRYTWKVIEDGKAVRVTILSDEHYKDAPLVYSWQAADGSVVEENVFLDLEPGASYQRTWHPSTVVGPGQLIIEMNDR